MKLIAALATAACALVMTVAQAAEPDWTLYQALLTAHVTPGTRNGVNLHVVDYARLRADPRFAQVIAELEVFPLRNLATREERLAFHINAYNLFALKMVADHWPLDSIKDVGNLWRPVWKRKAGSLGGEAVSLDDIEHARLRPMGEPRMHLAIVCASVSCPDLRAEPYRAAQLDAQLADQAQQFLNNPAKGLRVDGNTAHVSKIFDWFGEDFAPLGGIAGFVRKFHPLPEAITVKADLPYDWQVNARP